MAKWLLIFLFAGTALSAKAPPVVLTWKQLESVDFEEKFVKELEENMLFPKFPASLRQLDGKEVQVKGFVVPIDKKGEVIALSANPYAACFFCGKAGPASVMTVRLRQKNTALKIDDFFMFTGKLRLNDNDYKEFYYILEDAVQVK
jgi:hypothetical protein